MNRTPALLLAALIAVAPVAASAQERAPRGGAQREQQAERPQISEAEAQRIAQSRAGGARFVGFRGYRNGRYVFRFDDDGRIFDISVDASGR